MLARLRRLDDAIARVESVFLVVAHATIAALVVVAVLMRYVLNDPLTWGEEFIVALFTWMLLIGAGAAARERMHIRIDAFVNAVGPGARKVAGLIAVVATLVILVALVWFGVVHAVGVAGSETPMLGISFAWIVSALPVGMAFFALHLVRLLVDHDVDAAFRGASEVAPAASPR